MLDKQIFLDTGFFLDNKFLDEYLLFLQKSFSLVGYCEQHHILPVVIYKYKYNCKDRKEAEKLADMDDNNSKLTLLYKDHCIAHWLLYNCTTGVVKEANSNAYLQMTKKINIDKDHRLTEEEAEILQQWRNAIMQNEKRYWKKFELNWLKENYSKFSTKECAAYLHKTTKAIECKAGRLGLKRRSYSAKNQVKWTNADIEFLKENYLQYSVAELAIKLNRTEAAVKAYISKLHIADKRHIRMIYCKELNKTWPNIHMAAKELNISSQQIYAVLTNMQHKTHNLTFQYKDLEDK